MEGFIVSARKYRPVRFADVIGQPQVTQTLKNAIRQNQVAQAFLFCGPRGVGKTTCARILAKVLNCEKHTADIEACNECPACLTFNQNASFNIHELDAASNNSVDDIRVLIDQVRFAPQQGKWKIYIIDEVHMLSQAAFNAFLKTLEEPPSYAIFILATTEKHKIIPTILSRCQIFDFNRIKTEDAAAYLRDIAQKEQIQADDEALHLIAQKADGAMRDALSMFDRLSIFDNNAITYQSAIENLNVLDYDYFFKVTDSFLAKDINSILVTFDQIIKKGFEGDNFIQGLAEHMRNLMLASSKETSVILDLSENLKQRFIAQAMYVPFSFLLNALNIIHDADARYKQAKNKRLLVELMLIKLCHLKEYIEGNRSSEVKKKPDSEVKMVIPVIREQMESEIKIQVQSIPQPSVDQEPEHLKTNTISNQPSLGIKPVTRKGLSDIKRSLSEGTESATKKESVSYTDDELIEIDAGAFSQCIEALMNKLKQEQKQSLYSAINSYPPILQNKKRIQIPVSSSSLQKLLVDHKDDIASFIRDFLKLSKLSFEVIFDAEAAQREQFIKPFTPEQRYDYLKKINPKIEQLRKKFRFDIS